MKKQHSKDKPSQVTMTKGQRFPLTIKRMGIDGEGVGYYKRQVVFVRGALPGEEIVCEVTKVHRKFAEGRVRKIRKASPDRVEAPCPYYDHCGGCQLQHFSYEGQLREKRDVVRQAFERYTKVSFGRVELKQTVGMKDPWRYRNKSQMQAGNDDGKLIVGLYQTDSHRLIDIPECIVQHPKTDEVTRTVKEILEQLNIPAYNEKKRQGVVRTIVTRAGFETGEVQLVLVTATKDLPKEELILERVKERLPFVESVVHNINSRKTSLIFGDETRVIAGKEKIREELGDLSFDLSARAFFQLNPVQTEKLYNMAKEAARLSGTEKVADAYCGVGTIGLWLADGAGEIRGMDVIEDSIRDARKNAERLGVNAVYETGKAEKWLPQWEKEGWTPDVLVVDPPRSGLDDSLLETIRRVKPKRIVYVSCNPSTLAKNTNVLVKGGYRLEQLQPVDMFPQTAQVEVVSSFVLKEGK
ncbi:23S rRNA (uracil(1939)-C(5))-methyltransferase RlmD [Alteribacter natronophilus]|uniref:23S rRNA (uracil(1939)-C(5))-methyltransferase RlmD n=1 Tax=Alteribacter natronophilus TaxID=2583810 RepID=UPI00110DAC6D|nr:23S rRNA (uracil(1939)-C(5))-methyltransferase RlmD [Alteribacter natronophilus]TMW70593.1 23S rRNA (uracil(1939)-C(5))-methyltransferase RlmD [Alteribacter natronophilus]